MNVNVFLHYSDQTISLRRGLVLECFTTQTYNVKNLLILADDATCSSINIRRTVTSGYGEEAGLNENSLHSSLLNK